MVAGRLTQTAAAQGYACPPPPWRALPATLATPCTWKCVKKVTLQLVNSLQVLPVIWMGIVKAGVHNARHA